jgi:hypothetical protein
VKGEQEMTKEMNHNRSDARFTADEITEIDLLCSCQKRNDTGSRYCGRCGSQLSPRSITTTQPLPQMVTATPAEQTATTADLAECRSLERRFENSDAPDAWYQIKVQQRAAEALQKIILLMNGIHASTMAASAAKGAGINEDRFRRLNELRESLDELQGVVRIRLLGEISDHLKVIDSVALRLLAQEFKAKK